MTAATTTTGYPEVPVGAILAGAAGVRSLLLALLGCAVASLLLYLSAIRAAGAPAASADERKAA